MLAVKYPEHHRLPYPFSKVAPSLTTSYAWQVLRLCESSEAVLSSLLSHSSLGLERVEKTLSLLERVKREADEIRDELRGADVFLFSADVENEGAFVKAVPIRNGDSNDQSRLSARFPDGPSASGKFHDSVAVLPVTHFEMVSPRQRPIQTLVEG